ncbi:MAG: septal ring lytic transglycosylase RlpA family protein [Gammaproteobacteria bacterium]
MRGLRLYRSRVVSVHITLVLGVGLSLLLTSCGIVVKRDGLGPVEREKIDNVITRSEPRSRYGNPESYEVFGKRYHTLTSSRGFRERGIASWYGKKFHGRNTSSGEVYDMYQMTAAHKHLPLPTYVKVTNLENGRSAILRVNDRGPFHENRVIDLSYAAALKLGITKKGTAFVEISAVNDGLAQPGSDKELVSKSAAEDLRLYLQIGAFNERLNAQRLSKRVARYAPKQVQIHEANSSGQAIYRVQLGPIATIDLADKLVNTLSGLGIKEHHFVIN